MKPCPTIANELDPFTMESVVELGSDAFRISAAGTRGLIYLLSAKGLAQSIHARGYAICPYTRRLLTETEIVRLDRALGLCVLQSCWYAVASGDARKETERMRVLADAVLGLEFVSREMLAAAPRISVATLVIVLQRVVRNLCRQFGRDRVASAIAWQSREHAEESSMRRLLRRLARIASLINDSTRTVENA